MAKADGEATGQSGQLDMLHWSRTYETLPGIPDEFLDANGAPRGVWTQFLNAFSEFAPKEIERRFAIADQHMRDAGVSYRAPGETADRSWPRQ